MSDQILEREDDREQVNGTAINGEDVQAMLAKRDREIEDLRRQVESERTGRSRAEQQAQTAHRSRWDAEEAAVQARLDGADAEAQGLRTAYATALQEGRFEDAAELQAKMSHLSARLINDQQYQQYLATEKQRQQQPPQQRPSEVDLNTFSAAQRRWIAENPDYMTDKTVRDRAVAGHYFATSRGLQVDSPEYFDIISETVRGQTKVRREKAPPQRAQPQVEDEDEDEAEPPPPRQREVVTADMPVTRRPPGVASKPRQVRLTPEQQEGADITLSDVPVQGHHDTNGNWVPGRYEKYMMNLDAMKRRNGGG
jgi:hypothetical protein